MPASNQPPHVRISATAVWSVPDESRPSKHGQTIRASLLATTLQPQKQNTGVMALPSLAPSPMLDERQLAALSSCVASILGDLVAGATSATFVAEAMDAVLSAARSSCAGFAAQWNDLNTRTITKRLPIEVLTACLSSADFSTRVRASQVSRAWRSALVSDPRLWNDIYCPITRRPARAFRLLEELLQRSSPLPIRLRFPHTDYTDYSDCRSHITALVAPHIHRLQSYDGPYDVFVDLDPSGRPLPALTSLYLCNPGHDGYIDQRPEWSAPRLPNLRRLVAPVLKMIETQPYERLQHLVCGLGVYGDSGNLALSFPNLVTAEFLTIEEPMLLPRGPLPSKIECITLRAARLTGQLFYDTDEDFACLHEWVAERIPRLVLHGANSVSAISHAFVSAHGTASRLDVGSELRIASAPGAQHSIWEVHTCDYLWHQHGDGEMRAMLAIAAAPSICVTNYLICPFFAARAHLPHLVSLTFKLADITGQTLPPDADGTHYAEAPNLQHVRLETCGCKWTLGVLQDKFREMIIYEAELLETLTVDYLGYEVTKDSDCAKLALFAKQYIEVR